MNRLEALMLRRCDEQVRKPWREPDADECPNPPCVCEVCGSVWAPRRRVNGEASPVCVECQRKGWRPRRCECGRLMRNSDYQHGRCQPCRRAEAA